MFFFVSFLDCNLGVSNWLIHGSLRLHLTYTCSAIPGPRVCCAPSHPSFSFLALGEFFFSNKINTFLLSFRKLATELAQTENPSAFTSWAVPSPVGQTHTSPNTSTIVYFSHDGGQPSPPSLLLTTQQAALTPQGSRREKANMVFRISTRHPHGNHQFTVVQGLAERDRNKGMASLSEMSSTTHNIFHCTKLASFEHIIVRTSVVSR